MRTTFYKTLVFSAFAVLFAHNSIPHHHHYGELVPSTHQHHDGHEHGHGHGHSALAFMHIDEVFVHQDVVLKPICQPEGIKASLVWIYTASNTEDFTEHFNPTDHASPLLPDLLTSLHFRGPPVV